MHQLLRKRSNRRNAFTLLEVLVVVAIIVILASVGTIYFFRYLDDAKKDSAKAKAHNIATAAKSYYIKYGVAPSAQDLITPPDGGKPFLVGGKTAITTPWNELYIVTEYTRGDSTEMNFIVKWNDPDGARTYPDH
jgi:general secretion pathway protein G